jgi:hypothetical protein
VKRFIIITLSTIIFIAVAILVLVQLSPPPPLNLLNEASANLSKARDKGARIYAASLYNEAKLYYDSAKIVFNDENNKLLLVKKFEKTSSLATRSIKKSDQAIKQSGELQQSHISGLEEEIAKLQKLLDESALIADFFPVEQSLRKQYAKGKLQLDEVVLLLEHGKLAEASKKIEQSRKNISETYIGLRKRAEQYFENLPLWQSQYNKAVELSRKTKTWFIIVDKCAHKLELYNKGQVYKTYNIDLSMNWVGHKKYRGDNSTPEGFYKITTKKSGSSTIYHKALLIDYPNKEDKERFAKAKAEGRIDKKAHIGNLIEIHGHGGQGVNWTNGCVALSNSDMDNLYSKVPVGTQVLIIGSNKPLNFVLQNGRQE